MPPKTRNQSSTELDEDESPSAQHASTNSDAQLLDDFLKNVLGRKTDDDPIRLALKKEKIESIDMLLGLVYEEIASLTYDSQHGFEDDGITPKYKSATLPIGHKSLMIHFRTYILHEYEENGIDLTTDWTQFDKVKFNQYRTSWEAVTRYHQFQNTPVAKSNPVITQPSPVQQ